VEHFSDRLAEAVIAKRSVVCVGIDPDLARMPPELVRACRERASAEGDERAVAACFEQFSCGVIAAVADVAAAIKPQAAFFEQYGAPGWAALRAVIDCAHAHDLTVILDVKRGDIASTGAAYARAVFGGAPGFAGAAPGLGADAATVSPYLGDDSLTPFTDRCAEGKGVFVVTRTSNRGAALLQERESHGRAMYLHVADLVAQLGAAHVGTHGYSDVGAVAGATAPEALRAVRAALPNAWLLVPGYGAQGAGPAALAGIAAGDAAGYVVNASRSIIYAWQQNGEEYRVAAARAAGEMRDELRRVL
jgi:orotidine-5'-phosphate decarboxylase